MPSAPSTLLYSKKEITATLQPVYLYPFSRYYSRDWSKDCKGKTQPAVTACIGSIENRNWKSPYISARACRKLLFSPNTYKEQNADREVHGKKPVNDSDPHQEAQRQYLKKSWHGGGRWTAPVKTDNRQKNWCRKIELLPVKRTVKKYKIFPAGSHCAASRQLAVISLTRIFFLYYYTFTLVK